MWLKFTQKDNRLLGSNKRIHMPRSVSSVLFPVWEERGGLQSRDGALKSKKGTLKRVRKIGYPPI